MGQLYEEQYNGNKIKPYTITKYVLEAKEIVIFASHKAIIRNKDAIMGESESVENQKDNQQSKKKNKSLIYFSNLITVYSLKIF